MVAVPFFVGECTAVGPAPFLYQLGVIAHGLLVLARAEGIAAALRCVFAHPTGCPAALIGVARC